MVEIFDYRAADGTRLSCASVGDGPAVLLLHGLFSNAHTNWIRFGTAERLAKAGYRVLMPDLRGHGHSDSPKTATGWPADVLASDAEDLIRHLGLTSGDYVLGGYSLGCRTAVRLLVRGARPRAAILAGMGLDGIASLSERGQWFIRMIEGRGQWKQGSAEYLAESFMKANIADPTPLVWLLQRQPVTPLAEIAAIDLPVLVLIGAADDSRGSADDLVELLPQARLAEIPGNHMTAITRPEFGQAMTDFLQQ